MSFLSRKLVLAAALLLVPGGVVFGQDNDRWHDRDHDRGNPEESQAHRFGYEDGMHDGARDRASGHSFRPTHDSNYEHAERGWNSSMGDKQEYKDQYRAAYEEGYQRGYKH
jgi:hypothetical protein